MAGAVISLEPFRNWGGDMTRNAAKSVPDGLRGAITAKVAGSRYFNVFFTSGTLFSRGVVTDFPYNCASRRTGPRWWAEPSKCREVV